MRLILSYTLEGGRDYLVLPCVLSLIMGVKKIWASGDDHVVEVAFQASGSMRVDNFEGGWVGN